MSEPTETLGDTLPKEIERCRQVVADYESIGPAGAFGAAMIRQDIARATEAMISGDVVAILRAYQTLKNTNS